MDDFINERTDNDSIMFKIYEEIEFQKEEKHVNLITESDCINNIKRTL